MCRFLVYKGSEQILLSKLILNPSHSILNQSYDSRLRLDTRRPHNGDGFGIGYYTDIKLGPDPCIFTSTIPAWNCINLQRIASKTASSLIFAHVRATTAGSLSDDNSHPFSYGTLMWMHNGGLGAWDHIKRRLGATLRDRWYNKVQGSTDTEWAFALFLNELDSMGLDPSNPGPTGFGPTVLRTALARTIHQINQFVKAVPKEVVEEEEQRRSLLNFAVSDGHTVVCSRYVSSKEDEAASLYYSSGTSWDDKTDGNYHMDRKDKGADVVLVASEPLTFERDNWVTVPTNSIITIHKQTVMIHPIKDEYYNPSPDFKRSSKLAISKGFNTNEKAPTPQNPSPAATSAFPSPNTGNNTTFPVMSNDRHNAHDDDPFKDKENALVEEFVLHQRQLKSMVGISRFDSITNASRQTSLISSENKVRLEKRLGKRATLMKNLLKFVPFQGASASKLRQVSSASNKNERHTRTEAGARSYSGYLPFKVQEAESKLTVADDPLKHVREWVLSQGEYETQRAYAIPSPEPLPYQYHRCRSSIASFADGATRGREQSATDQ